MNADSFQPRARLLGELLAIAEVRSAAPIPADTVLVQDVTDDSRKIRPGSLFVAVKGDKQDGHRFIRSAVDRGAVAVVLSDASVGDARVPNIVVENSARDLAKIAAGFYGLTEIQQQRKLRIIGVTGTNGKSTTCHLIHHIFTAASEPTALLGTIKYCLLGREIPAPWTTPPAVDLTVHLVEAYHHGAQSAVMEVSSHALDQCRTDGIRFQTAVFTNLTGDHLDYHGDMDGYLRAKKRLFDRLDSEASAVVNADDPASSRIVADCKGHVMTFALDRPADFRAGEITCDVRSTRFRVRTRDREFEISMPLIGRHNISNALAAMAVATSAGIDSEAVRQALQVVPPVAGRLQRVEPPECPFSVFVDYAHTDDALQNALGTLRPLTRGDLWCVFGCGGERDRTKRPRMAAVTAKYADRIVITSDNPRAEDPMKIIEEILTGFTPQDRDRVILRPDRREAIEIALKQAQPGDVVLLAGKGHEDYQIIGNQRLHFNDVETAKEILNS